MVATQGTILLISCGDDLWFHFAQGYRLLLSLLWRLFSTGGHHYGFERKKRANSAASAFAFAP
jgi:hypothetical protein